MKLPAYAEELLQETIAATATGVDGGLRAEVFTRLIAERLTGAGEFNDAEVCFHTARGVAVSGWSFDDESEILHLFVTDHRAETPPPSLTQTSIKQSFQRLTEFFVRSLDGYADKLEESDPVFELADLIRHVGKSLMGLRLYLFSDAAAKEPVVPDAELNGMRITHHVWDVERLHRLDTSGLEREPIIVDIESRLGRPLPCLTGGETGDHAVHLMLVPADLLASLYDEFGARLLERNVRSFLQARGAVNKGIRKTLIEEPERFLAYNNGISATASGVSLVRTPDGIAIAEIRDLQIVNGGQTTASIHSAAKRDKVSMADVMVQAKLTVVDSDRIDEIVPSISRFANTQNRITNADFSSNGPFHVKVEELARSIWAPAPDGSQRQTHWFYERARGQYADELTRAGTPTQRKQYQFTNPPGQKITKTDLAKFEHAWEQLPHLVSLGAEKNFGHFTLRLDERPFTPDLAYFKRLVAKAILFRTTEKIVSAQKFGGYRANIVAYTIAKLVHATAHRLDLEGIWRSQQLTPATAEAIAQLSHLVHDVIISPSGRVRHIGEWSKKVDCWKRIEEMPWDVPVELRKELIALRSTPNATVRIDIGLATLSDEEQARISSAAVVEAETWFQLANWAKETLNLQPWQRSLAFSLGKRATQGAQPTVKQAAQGLRMLDEARRLGFAA